MNCSRPTFTSILQCLLLLMLGTSWSRAAVVIDGSFSDWDNIPAIYANPSFPPGTINHTGVSFIKTYQDDVYVYFSYAASSPDGQLGLIAFDLDRSSSPTDTYATIGAEAAWMLGLDAVEGSEVLHSPPIAAKLTPDPTHPNYNFYEWCFRRDQLLADGTRLFPDAGDEVWFAVGQQGSSIAGSQLTTFTIDLVAIPEPATLGFLWFGFAGIMRRSRSAKRPVAADE